jgi:glycosyltransferase A (GT-A) superfamily protein (DUF2064 family)
MNSRSKKMPRRAILIFAEGTGLDLARRRFPAAVHSLLRSPAAEAVTIAAVDLHIFTSADCEGFAGAQRHRQTGRHFTERFENAIAAVEGLGYDEIVVVGRDCPHLCGADIVTAFGQLAHKRLVLGPDHRGGCYLIAFRGSDRDLLSGIRWKRNTDCEQLRRRCNPAEVFLLPVKHDLDSWADVRAFARSAGSLSNLASFLLEIFCSFCAAARVFVDLAAQRIRVRWQMPPPALAV